MSRRALAVLGLAAVLAAAPAAPAQPPRSQFLEGTHAFRRILYDAAGRKLTPLKEREASDPGHTLIVVLGDSRPLDALEPHPGWLREFVRHGGALLVATDQQAVRVLWAEFGVRVTGQLLTLPDADADAAFRGMRECPYL
jgi:hypothetical protein